MITAIILAAGRSTRMGTPKMLLRWKKTTVIEHIISVFDDAGIDDILVVTGGAHEQMEEVLRQCKKRHPVRSIYNEEYQTGEMLSSIQCGLKNMNDTVEAALIGLGDQPQVLESTVQLLKESFLHSKSLLIVPSYLMRRGHPWLVARPLWMELSLMDHTQTPRDFLNAHPGEVLYLNLETPSILADLDTLEDYRSARPE